MASVVKNIVKSLSVKYGFDAKDAIDYIAMAAIASIDGMDEHIKNATKDAWARQKKEQLARAYDFFVRKWKIPLTIEEFEKVWYSEHGDKKGEEHIANMCMSMFQSRKANAGSGFERSIYDCLEKLGIEVIPQALVDKDGNIYSKKPKSISVDKVDGLIPTSDNRKTIHDMYVLSMKTTSRERYTQGFHLISKCKGYVFLTRETPEAPKIQTITGKGAILVYPDATTSESVWSYSSFFQKFHQMAGNSSSQ
jgi:hypothetical protein